MTAYGYSENAQFRHSDKAPGRNLDVIASRLSLANGEPLCFDLPRPETLFVGLFYSQLTLELATDLGTLQPPTRYPHNPV